MDIEKLVEDLQDYADGLGAAPIIVHDRDELSGLLVRAAAALRSAQVLANRWQDEAAESWGETKEHATLQRCADKLRALLAATKQVRLE